MKAQSDEAGQKAVELRKKYWSHFDGKGQDTSEHRIKNGTLLYTDVVSQFRWSKDCYEYRWSGISIQFDGWSRGGAPVRYEPLPDGYSLWVMSVFDKYEDGYYLMLVNEDSEVEEYIYWNGSSEYGGEYYNEYLAEKFTDHFITLSLEEIRNKMKVMAKARIRYGEIPSEEFNKNVEAIVEMTKSIMESKGE